MCKTSICLFLGVLILSFGAGMAGGQPLQQDPGPDGIVSVEAENFDENVPNDPHTWELITEVADGFVPPDGFSGGFAMQNTPTTLAGGAGNNDPADFLANSPRLDYQIEFVHTGTHYVWVLAYGMDGNSDSMHSGLDGEHVETADRISLASGTLTWRNIAYQDPERIMFEVDTPGLHTLNLWMREDGATVDKIVLTTNPDYTPTGMGPAESARGARTEASGPQPADMAIDVPRDTALAWSPGEYAATHDVYFGTVADDVNNADRANPLGVLVSQGQEASSYEFPSVLEFGQTYYWRVDEVNAAPDNTIFKGGLWSFTVEPFTYPLENITATASSATPDAGPENTVNGSGMDADDLHSTDLNAMWLSAADGEQPAWIQFEFDRVYKVHELLIWNYNVSFEVVLGYGFKDTTVEYSENGTDWTVLTDVEFAKASSADGYASNTIVDMAGVSARYIRLTANSNWGMFPQYGLSEVRFTYIPTYPREPMPADGATDVSVEAMLEWRAGREAAAHEIYFGTDEAAVADGTALVDTATAAMYDPAGLDFGHTYYWKIVEANEAETPSAWEGDLWSFSAQEYFVVEDFESYDDADNRIFDTWLDGFANLTGSTVGYFEAPFAEQTVIHGGNQSMPLEYSNADSPWYSETERRFDATQNWATNGADTLTVFFKGNPVDFLERADGSIVIGAAGADIWNAADEFRYVYKTFTGDGSIVARVDSLVEVDPWTKAGVMIRETLDAGSKFAGVYITPGQGCRYQAREATNVAATSDTSVATPEQIAVTAPHWVKLERVGNEINGFYSADGTTWTAMSWNPQTITMLGTIHIGLAVTSHSAGNPTSAEFSEIATTGNVTGAWQVETIGIEQPSNDPGSVYVAVEDTNGNVSVVAHPDPEATLLLDWQEWQIPLSEFAGVNMARVEAMYIGVGDRDNPTAGGNGLFFIDDIWVGHPAAAVE